MTVKDFLRKIPLVRPIFRGIKAFFLYLRVVPALLQERRIQRTGGPIKVGFLCQYIPAWTKTEDLYRRMKEDDRFETYLICLPDRIKNNQLDHPESLENDAYTYCLSHGYPEAINALVGQDTWLDLEAMELAYVFYARPYNHLLPLPYTTPRVSRYSRACVIMYGIGFCEELSRVALNSDFMSNVYYFFADLPFMQEINKSARPLLHRLGLQKTECHGYPMLEHLLTFKDVQSPSFAFSHNDFRVLWTPRWTTDKALGASNFFNYHQDMLDYAVSHPKVDLLLRPHPLMFSHFIETGEMTQSEADAYIARCDALPNVSLDHEHGYEATLWNADVMVSDISSMMIEYFITGKPLIFCASNMELHLVDSMKRMLEGCYIVNNKEDLLACLQMLEDGTDPLKELREQIIREQFSNTVGACSNIINALAEDYAERN